MSDANPQTDSVLTDAPVRALNAFPIRLLLPVALFCTYPMALVFGVGVPFTPEYVFHIAIPTFALLTLASIPYLLGGECRGTGAKGSLLARWLPVAVLLFLVSYAFSAILGKSIRADEIAGTMGLVLLPVFFAVAPRNFLPKRLPLLLTVLWTVNVVHCLIQVAVGFNVVALAGNMNWAATLLACLLPWVWLSARRTHRPTFWLVVAVSSGLTGWLVWLCHCRATWLAVGLYAVYLLVTRVVRGHWRAVAGVGVLVLGVAAAFLLRGHIEAAMADDIRYPLYTRTVESTLSHPVLGEGPGNFRREFAGKRTREHLSRRVCAAVTEHPHNEVLRLAFELGWPTAIAWVALVAVALFGGSNRGGAMWQACHCSAFLLLAHGMLDKPLIMAPTSVLAVFFLGLLLRWRLPVRLVAPTGPRVLLQRLLAALAVAVGGYLTVATVWRGSLFRRALVAEGAGYSQTAYEAYVEATKIVPWDMRAHAYAGMAASGNLGDSALALPHLSRAWEMEPDFAHINREIGRSFGRTRNHADALRFFAREAELFPFDASAWRDLFICGLLTGGLQDLGRVQDELCRLRLESVARAIGRVRKTDGVAEAKRMAAAFALAAEGGEIGQDTEALALAQQLSAGLVLPGFEGQRPTANPKLYSMLDVAFWHVRLKWRNAWLHCDRSDPEALLKTWDGLPRELRVVGFAEFAESAGWRTLVVRTTPEVVEMRRGSASFLVVPKNGRTMEGAGVEQLVGGDALRKELGVVSGDGALAVLVRTGQFRMYERVQYLGYVLHALLPDTMPGLYRSPTAMFYAAQRRFQQAKLPVTVHLDAVQE